MTADAAPVARIRTAALVANVRAAGLDAPVLDLRRDAYGHGAETVASALRAQTDARFLLDDTADERRSATLTPAELYGWDAGEPAMTLVGTVLGVKDLRAGDGVSYGYLHRAPHDTRVALVTGGYAQGVVRSLGGRASVVIGETPHPIVGRVAMDVCVVDIGEAAVERGAEAVFFGAGGSRVGAWARATGWRTSEIVAAVGLRTRREYVA